MDYLLLGTIVLAVQKPSAIYVGVDSKVIAVGPQILNVDPQSKIHEKNGVVFAHAGIFKDSKIDVVATANDAIAEDGDLEEIVDRFVSRIEVQLSASLSDFREQNAGYFKNKMKKPLEILFASAHQGGPRTIVVSFEIIDPSASLAFRISRVRCPRDCQGPVATIGIGVHEAASNFLASDPEVLDRLGPIAAIQEAIRVQASATPEFISLPSVVVAIDDSGIHRVPP
jgi:hypothetical protein